MKKNYLKILTVLTLAISGELLNAQCTAPSPPTVSGTTLAVCTNSAVFTLTGTTTGTNVIGWYANSFGGNALSTNTVFTTPTLTQTKTYYVGQAASSATVDSLAMPQYSETVGSNEARGYYFTAPFDFTIKGLRAPVAINSSTVSSLAVLKFPAVPPLYNGVSGTNTFSTLYLNQSATGTNVIAVNIPVYAGDIIGVLGERGGYSCYGPYILPVQSTLGISTNTLNLYRLGMSYDLSTNAPQDLWTETNNRTIGNVELYASLGCNSTLTPVTVSVVPVPTIAIAAPPHVCANSAYTLQAGGVSTYTWSGGPQTASYVINPSTTTTYSVMGSIFGTCNSTLTTVTVTVDPGVPVLNATSSSPSVCSGNTIALTGAGVPTFTWLGGVNSVSDGIAFVPLSTQQYTLLGSNACGTGSTTITVPVNPTPTLITSATSSAICLGQTTTLHVTGATTYSWTGASGPGSNFTVSPTVNTPYSVTGVSSAGCVSSSQQVIIVNSNPTVTAVTTKTLVCSAGPATLTTSGANTYSWSSGATTTLTVVNPTTNTVYTVTGTYSATGCSSTNTVEVDVFIPIMQVSNSATVCNGAALTLTADAGGSTTYSWSTGSNFNSTSITATAAAVYTVTGHTTITGSVSNCISSATVSIGVNPNPTITVSATKTVICKGEKLLLTASGGSTYTWSNSTTTNHTVNVAPTVINSITTYSAMGTDANGCSSTGTFAVKVSACTGINEVEKDEDLLSIYPNPNDGNFVISAKGNTHAVLINELGQVIKELEFSEENQFRQNVSGLSNGIYFIKGSYNGTALSGKIVINK